VLHYGEIPKIDTAAWTFTVGGEVKTACRWTWGEFGALPRRTVRCDIHCVTAWSRFDNTFEGVPAAEVLARARPAAGTVAAMVRSYGGYTTNVLLDDLMRDEVILAFTHDGRPLTSEHGGPCRLIVPHLYFWKSAKWVRGMDVLREDRPGFWEQNGYHIRGDPWREERYQDGPFGKATEYSVLCAGQQVGTLTLPNG
jgi:DMSO/TMAO reductase YedYZ molybdopterin-dependent catalytic subunit